MSTVNDAVQEAYDRDVEHAQRALQAVSSGTPVVEVAAQLIQKQGLSEQAVREAIMDALYEGEWTLTSDRKLVRPSSQE